MMVVTAPTGNIGHQVHQVLENILCGDELVHVIAREPSTLPAKVRKRVEVVEASHSDADVVN
jgi:uncharacterized protein YbjT (DUF2867 family)